MQYIIYQLKIFKIFTRARDDRSGVVRTRKRKIVARTQISTISVLAEFAYFIDLTERDEFVNI